MKQLGKNLGLLVLNIALVVGLVVFSFLFAAGIGGNYFQEFRMFGVQGYEATGILGFWIGIGLGVIASLVLWRKRLRKFFYKKN